MVTKINSNSDGNSQNKAILKNPPAAPEKEQIYQARASVIFVAIDADQRVSMINKNGCKILDCNESQIVGRNWFDNFIPESRRENARNAFTKIMNGQIAAFEYFEYPILTCAGKERLIAWHNTLLKNQDGKPSGTLSAGEDIADRQYREETLMASERKFRSLFESCKDFIHLLDQDGHILQTNPATLIRLGYSEDEFLNRTLDEFFTPESKIKFRNNFPILLSGGEYHQQVDVICKNKEIIHVDCVATVTPHEKGGVQFCVFFQRDITELRHAEKQRENLNRILEEKNEELQSIIYAASHDVRQPLMVIEGFSKILAQSCETIKKKLHNENIPKELRNELKTILENEIAEAVEFIGRGVSDANKLWRGLIELSRLGREALNIELLDMNAIVGNIVKNLKLDTAKTGIEISIEHLPACHGDEVQIGQVFSNLIGNAIKYRDPLRAGKINISGRSDELNMIYCVADNGIGIAPHNLESIFNVFYQVDPSTPNSEGIGLAIVRRIVNRHNGKVWIESQLGSGSRFYVSLPQK